VTRRPETKKRPRSSEQGRFLSLEGIEAREFLPERLDSEWRLEWQMPLRIKEGNRFARDDRGVKLTTLIRSIHRRYHQIKGREAPQLDYRLHGEITRGEWRHLDLYRYSNRQHTRMKLGGLMGNLRIEGLDKESSRYLQLGEILGVGKQTVFGLGSYSLRPISGKEDG
jgi:CRISPR/Cas system endoribonuclease Cas6 (RAMP superfamily)